MIAIKVFRDGREVCQTDAAWQARRREAWERDGGRCVERRCRKRVPLHDLRDDCGDVIVVACHIDHISGRKMGGGFRDDRLENLRTLCAMCHSDRHVPRKVCPPKPKMVTL